MAGDDPEATLAETPGQVPDQAEPGDQGNREARGTGRFTGRIRRHPWLAGFASLVVAGAVAAAVLVALPSDYGEQITGPRGPYPASPGTGGTAPRVLATAPASVLITGGLAVEVTSATSQSSPTTGITAVNLRTGQKYWTYARPGHSVEGTATDQNTDYVLWDDGVLTSIDSRTARVGWHAKVDLDALGLGVRLVAPGQGKPVLLIGYTGIEAVGAVTGARLWTASVPNEGSRMDPCQYESGWPAVTGSTVTLLILDAVCTEGGYYGYSLATGQLEWRYAPSAGGQSDASQEPVVVGNGEVLASSPSGRGLSDVLLNTATGRPGPLIGKDDAAAVFSAGGGQAFQMGFGSDADSITALGIPSGRESWKATAPAGLTLSGSAVRMSNRVYVAAYSDGTAKTGPLDWWLLAFDASSGRLVSRDSLPAGQAANADTAEGSESAVPLINGAWPGGILTIVGSSPETTGAHVTLPTLVVATS